jgi:hypothetical protein
VIRVNFNSPTSFSLDLFLSILVVSFATLRALGLAVVAEIQPYAAPADPALETGGITIDQGIETEI